MDKVTVTMEMTGEQAQALAIFLKRMMLSDYRAKCQPDTLGDELAYTMQEGGEAVRTALADAGFAPR